MRKDLMFLSVLWNICVFLAGDSNSQIRIATVHSSTALAYGNSTKLVVGRGGVISLVFHDNGEIFYTESDDNGLDWSAPVNVSLNAGLSQFPGVAVDSVGRKHVVWQDNTVPDHPERWDDKVRIYYKNFTDTTEIAQRFGVPIGESVGNSLNPAIAVDGHGKLYVAWSAFMGLNLGWEINYCQGTLIGNGLLGAYDWTYPEIPGEPLGIGSSFFPSIAATRGVVFIAWLEQNPFFQWVDLVKFRHDDGWSKHFSLSDGAIGPYSSSTAGIPSIAVAGDSVAHATFQEILSAQDNTFNDVFYLDYEVGDTLTFGRGTNISRSAQPSSNPVIAIDGNSNLYVSWEQELSSQTDVFLSMKSGGEWSAPVNVSQSEFGSVSPQIAPLSDDSLLVVWVEGDASPYEIRAKNVKPVVTGVHQVDRRKPPPKDFELFQNYPNPFNGTTAARIYLSRAVQVEVNVFNVRGELMKTLRKGLAPKGYHLILWDGTDQKGEPVPSGIYLVLLKAGSGYETIKAILVR